MVANDRHQSVVGVAPRPVALPFQHGLKRGHGNDAGLDHALHGHVLSQGRGIARRVGDHVDLVAAFIHGGEGEGVVADTGPEAGDDDLLATGLGQRVAHLLIVPGVHGGALEQGMLGKDLQQFGEGVTGKGVGLDRGDAGRNVEKLSRLGEGDDVVLQRLPVDRLHPESHLRLVINENELAVVWCQKIRSGGHLPLLVYRPSYLLAYSQAAAAPLVFLFAQK